MSLDMFAISPVTPEDREHILAALDRLLDCRAPAASVPPSSWPGLVPAIHVFVKTF